MIRTLSRLVPFAAALCLATPALAQSVDCSRPTKPVARTVCTSPDLRAREEQLTEAYGALLAYTPRSERDGVQQAATAWEAERERTCDDKAKIRACTTLYDKRTEDLSKQSQAAQKKLAAVVAGIPKDASTAATALQRYDGAAAKAWLLYLHHTGALTAADRDAEIGRLAREIIENGLPNDPYLLEEMRNIGDVARADTGGMLLFLRHVLSTTDLDAPCFLFSKHGQPAFEAFGPFWGNGRDDTPELCHEGRSVYDMPEWKKLASLIDPAIAPALEERGSIRHGYERQFAIDALQASMVPSTLLEAPHSAEARKSAEAREKAVAAFRTWKDFKTWPEAQYKAAIAALPAAIAATSKLYQESFKLAPKIADQAARAAADRFIASRVVLLTTEETLDDE